MKQTARKVRRLYDDKVLAGFAGSVADAFTLFENSKLNYGGNLERAAVELAQEWRGDKQLRQLEAMLIVVDKSGILVVSGTGEVIAPDDDYYCDWFRWQLRIKCWSRIKTPCICLLNGL